MLKSSKSVNMGKIYRKLILKLINAEYVDEFKYIGEQKKIKSQKLEIWELNDEGNLMNRRLRKLSENTRKCNREDWREKNGMRREK